MGILFGGKSDLHLDIFEDAWLHHDLTPVSWSVDIMIFQQENSCKHMILCCELLGHRSTYYITLKIQNAHIIRCEPRRNGAYLWLILKYKKFDC